MRRNLYPLFAVFMLAAMLLGACSSAAPAAPAATQPPVVITQLVPGSTQVIVVTATPAPASVPITAGSVQINAAGATFPLPLYTEWTYAYSYVDPSVVINYQGIGSGGGKKGIIDGTLDFAGSDSLLSADDYTNGKDLQMYPMVASAVVPIFNLAGYDATKDKPLVLDRQTLVDIYNAKIKTWNDPEIVKLNPDLKDKLPAKNITAVHRSDGSGTTEIFTKALTSFSKDWTAGGAQTVEWPVDKAGNGIGGKGNPGVAAAVLNTPNSIGYVEIADAISNNIPFAQLVNKAGKTVTANADSLASAMADNKDAFDSKLNATIVDAPGDGSWPIAGYTYLILHTTSMKDCTKAQKIVEYIRWSLTDASAAKTAAKLGYAVLPGDIQKKVLDTLSKVTCNGQPVSK